MLTSPLFLLAQQQSPVFISGQEGYQTYRIPAIIRLSDKTLLAFCEGRKGSAADFGNIDIVMKRSMDNGRTWSPLQVIVDYGNLQAGNCAPVQDISDPLYPGGRIFLFYNTGNNHEGEVAKGNGLRECFYITSTDGGNNWSQPVNITAQVHRPKQPLLNPAYNFEEDWRTYANTPGHALQVTTGMYKGRIYVAANHSSGTPGPGATHYTSHGYFTDDHGKTFKLASSLNITGSNEATAAMLSNDRIMLNARNQRGDIKRRIVAISNNGGATWDTVYFDNQLPDPVCEGSLLNAGYKKGKPVLAFCNPADTTRRNRLTLRISYNQGKSWTKEMVIDSDPSPGTSHDYTAYSDIVYLQHKRIGILYERNNYREIVFAIKKF